MDWLICLTQLQYERTVVKRFQAQSLDAFVPCYREQRRWSDRWKTIEIPLFPGYVFFRAEFEQRMRVLKTPGVVSVVCSPPTKPVMAPDREVQALKRMVDSGLPVRSSELRKGPRVRITEGPLNGIEGILVREAASCKFAINIEPIERAAELEVEPTLVTAVAS